MTFRWLDRWGPLAGALGVMCFVVGIVLYGNGPKDDDQKIVAYFAKDSHQTKYLVAFYFFFVPIFVLWGWILVASGYMLLSTRRTAPPAAQSAG